MSDKADCGISDAVWSMSAVTYFITFYVIAPIYFIVGMTGNILLLVAFYKQSKTEDAYTYQVLLTVSKTLEIFFFSLFTFGSKWGSGADRDGASWYMHDYFLMLWAANLACPLLHTFMVSALLFSVAMTADRVFALTKPFVYKNINHKKHQRIATCFCFLIGFVISIYDGWRWRVLDKVILNGTTDGYLVKANEEFLASTLAIGLGQLRTVVRLIAVVALIVLNVIMAYAFRRRMRNVGQLKKDDKKDKEIKAAERTLLILTVYQSCLIALAQIPHCGYYIASFASVHFTACLGIVVAPFIDGTIFFADAADFFVIIAINKKMRKVVFKAFPCQYFQEETSGQLMIGNRVAPSSNA